MRIKAFLALCAVLSGCAAPPRVAEADGMATFNKTELAQITEFSCADELARRKHGQRWWLCGYGWRPAAEPGSEKAVESYRLFWVRANAPRMVLRLARYQDGSGALWVSSEEGKTPRMQVTTLKEAEFAPLFGRLQASPLWASSYAKLSTDSDKPAGCPALARWILEGRRPDDHRAVSVQSCGEGRWVLDLGTAMLKFAQSRIAGLAIEPIY